MTSPTGGTDREPVEDRLRLSMTATAARREPGPPPLPHILRAGRARRVRRRRMTVAAAACLMVCVAFPVARLTADRAGRAVVPPAVTASPRPPSPAPLGPVTVPVGSGTSGGVRWYAAYDYYATTPPGFTPAHDAPAHPPVLCRRMYLDDVRTDGKGGPWSDCDALPGPLLGGGYVTGRPGLEGYAVYFQDAVPGATLARVRLNDGTRLRPRVVTVPGARRGGFAFLLKPGQSVADLVQVNSVGEVVHTLE